MKPSVLSLAALVVAGGVCLHAQTPPAPHPPIAIPFTLAKPGYVTLVIDDAAGKRVRNLVSETPYPAGANVAWWDGLDDVGRDPEAAAHSVYDIPGKRVTPGRYTVRGLTRDAIVLRYQMAPYTHGDPPWNNGDPASEWLANHTPPQSALFVPAAGKDKKPTVLIGSYVTEGGSGLAWLDGAGRKYKGEGWIGGVWTGAPFLARDAGPNAVPDNDAYAGAAFSSELRLSAVTPGGDRALLSPAYEFPGVGAWNNTVASAAIGGLAVRDGLLTATLPKLKGGQLLFVDVAAAKVLGTTPLPDGRGLTFDAQGRLLALSGKRLLRFTLPPAVRAGRRLDHAGWTAAASVHSEDALKAVDADAGSRWSTDGPQAPGQWLSLDLGRARPFSRLTLRSDAPQDSPRGYTVAVSADGQTWGAPIAAGAGTGGVTTISFAPQTARYLKITQTAVSAATYWSVNTLDLYDAPTPAETRRWLDPGPSYGVALDRAGWTATASANPGEAGSALDSAYDTRWQTKADQAPGQTFTLDLKTPQAFDTLVMNCAGTDDYPKAYTVSVSDDGQTFGPPFASGAGGGHNTVAKFPSVTARYVRVTQTGSVNHWWGIAEITLFHAPAPGVGPFALLRTIGHPGAPQAGPYDPAHMNHPQGLTLDNQGRLWVAENDFQPKRVSVWDAGTGRLLQAFYGPPRYGGGGELDPHDPDRWLYDGMMFALDRKAGTARPTDVFDRAAPSGSFSDDHPQTPLYPTAPEARGQMFLTDAFNSSPTNGADVAGLWRMGADGVAHPVAALGLANGRNVFQGLTGQRENFSARWTGAVTPKTSGEYTFTTLSDDGVRLWVGGKKIMDDWTGHGATEDKAVVTLTAGHPYPIRLEYYNGGGSGVIRFYWQGPGAARTLVTPDRPGFRGEYFTDAALTHRLAARTDPAIDTDWPQGLPTDPKKAALAARLPLGADPGRSPWDNAVLFLWTDTNGDGKMDASEVTFQKMTGPVDGITVLPDLSLVATNVSGETRRYAPARWTAAGLPLYDLARHETLATGAQHPTTSGGGQALVGRDGWTVETVAPAPLAPQGPGGVKNGVALWSYPSLWPGLHASHIAPLPDHPGELIGTTRLLGGTITPKGSDAGELWAVNGNKGNLYLFTTDGLFVATLFHDSRTASWNFPKAMPGMTVNDASNQEEDFWPEWTQTPSGDVFLTTGTSYLVQVAGLDTVARLPDAALDVTPDLLTQARAYFVASEARRQAALSASDGPLVVALRPTAPVLGGKPDDWAGASWATVDTRADQQGDWGRSEAKAQAALAVSGDRLYAAYKTGDRDLLRNDGSNRPLLFKTGGALDLMLDAVPGGERLLVTQVGGKVAAMLYQPKSSTGKTSPFDFTSPQRTVHFDRVEDVSAQVMLASDGAGGYEFSVPLTLLGLTPQAGQTLHGDLGLLRGNGFQTLQRVYWRNKATGLVSDIPSEAELTSQLWGTWVIKQLWGTPVVK